MLIWLLQERCRDESTYQAETLHTVAVATMASISRIFMLPEEEINKFNIVGVSNCKDSCGVIVDDKMHFIKIKLYIIY